MVRRTRAEMEETRASLLATARRAFAERGYGETSMDDLTAQAGFTRGALYHHFGDKRGLLIAVVEQIDAEMDDRLQALSDGAPDSWTGFYARCRAYLDMALEPEIQRIVLRDARAVLGGASPESQRLCVRSMQHMIDELMQNELMVKADSWVLASMIYGMLAEAALWIAQGDAGSERRDASVQALDLLLQGLRLPDGRRAASARQASR